MPFAVAIHENDSPPVLEMVNCVWAPRQRSNGPGCVAARVAGTRIPVTAVKAYLDAGCSTDDVIAAYPDLSRQDVDAVRDYLRRNTAA